MILKGYIFSVLYAFLCLGLALVAYKLGMPKKYSRKLVHILVGAEWIILSHYMGATYHFLTVCIFFLLVLLISYLKNLMPMISSESDNAPGPVYYAVAMSIMAIISIFVPDMLIPFGVGVFCTSLGDGLAGIAGQLIKNHNPRIYGKKSLFGTLVNFAASSLTALIFKLVFNLNLNAWQCIAIGVFSAGLEIITVLGLDNIVITVGCSLLTYGFLCYPLINAFVLPIILTPFIIALVIEKKVLTRWGLALAMLLDVVISVFLGNFGFVLLCAFLFGSVVIDKFKRRAKRVDTVAKKGDCRDAIQVAANGLIPMLMAIMYAITRSEAFIVGYVAALAEAFADTAASGVGMYSRNVFDIFRMKRTKHGLSGGMSVIGTAASLIGAFVIALIALAFGAIDLKLLLLTALCGFAGSVFDSFLGSLFQVKYKCSKCSEITEKTEHCGAETEKVSGFYFFDNDVVNLVSGLFAAVLASVLYILLVK